MSSGNIVVLGIITLSVSYFVFSGDSTNDSNTDVIYETSYDQELNIDVDHGTFEEVVSTHYESINNDNLREDLNIYSDQLLEKGGREGESNSNKYDAIVQELEQIAAEYEKSLDRAVMSPTMSSKYNGVTYTYSYSNKTTNVNSEYSVTTYTPRSTNNTPIYPIRTYENNVNSERVYVNGYYKSNGTYVEPYIRTAPNNSIDDNFTYYKNYNPYTAEKGSIYR